MLVENVKTAKEKEKRNIPRRPSAAVYHVVRPLLMTSVSYLHRCHSRTLLHRRRHLLVDRLSRNRNHLLNLVPVQTVRIKLRVQTLTFKRVPSKLQEPYALP